MPYSNDYSDAAASLFAQDPNAQPQFDPNSLFATNASIMAQARATTAGKQKKSMLGGLGGGGATSGAAMNDAAKMTQAYANNQGNSPTMMQDAASGASPMQMAVDQNQAGVNATKQPSDAELFKRDQDAFNFSGDYGMSRLASGATNKPIMFDQPAAGNNNNSNGSLGLGLQPQTQELMSGQTLFSPDDHGRAPQVQPRTAATTGMHDSGPDFSGSKSLRARGMAASQMQGDGKPGFWDGIWNRDKARYQANDTASRLFQQADQMENSELRTYQMAHPEKFSQPVPTQAHPADQDVWQGGQMIHAGVPKQEKPPAPHFGADDEGYFGQTDPSTNLFKRTLREGNVQIPPPEGQQGPPALGRGLVPFKQAPPPTKPEYESLLGSSGETLTVPKDSLGIINDPRTGKPFKRDTGVDVGRAQSGFRTEAEIKKETRVAMSPEAIDKEARARLSVEKGTPGWTINSLQPGYEQKRLQQLRSDVASEPGRSTGAASSSAKPQDPPKVKKKFNMQGNRVE